MAGEFLQSFGQGFADAGLLFQRNLNEQQQRKRQEQMDALSKLKIENDIKQQQMQMDQMNNTGMTPEILAMQQKMQDMKRQSTASDLLSQFSRGQTGQDMMQRFGAGSTVDLEPPSPDVAAKPLGALGGLDFSQMQTTQRPGASIPERFARPAGQMDDLQARLTGMRDLPAVDKTLGRLESVEDKRLDMESKEADRELAERRLEMDERESQVGIKKDELTIKQLEKEIEEMPAAGEVSQNITPENQMIWDKLDSKYTKSISVERDSLSSLARLNTLLDQATGSGDIAAIFTFMKALDPSSVVRESEFALPAEASGVFNRMMNTTTRWKEGDILDPKARADIKETAKELQRIIRGNAKKINNRYSDLSRRAGLAPDLVVDFGVGSGGGGESQVDTGGFNFIGVE